MQDRILLIDGLNFIYRAKIAFKPKDKKIDYTVIFNFFRNLRALVEQLQPTKVFFVLEGGNNFRYKIDRNYKANRIIKRAEEEVKRSANFDRQRDEIIRLLPYLPIYLVKAYGFEADDTIYNLCLNLENEDITIVSNDKDYTQILQKNLKNIKIYNPFDKSFVTNPAYHFVTYLCLAGDKSDNIEGLVSDKYAIKIAQDVQLLSKFLDNPETLSHFNSNKSLIELRPFNSEIIQIIPYHKNYNILRKEFGRMDFQTMLVDSYWARFINTFETLA